MARPPSPSFAPGTQFEGWTVLSEADVSGPYRYYNCLCECGSQYVIRGSRLKSGHSKRCRACSTSKRCTRHGHTKNGTMTRTYTTWHAMVARCTVPSQGAYPNYGGRGIKVCSRWLKFENFLADMGERPANTSIERINNNLGYYKRNCKWAGRVEQQNNRATSVHILHGGIKLSVRQWAKRLSIPPNTIAQRLAKGWPMHMVFHKGKLHRGKHKFVPITRTRK